jgi:hypothetical protein
VVRTLAAEIFGAPEYDGRLEGLHTNACIRSAMQFAAITVAGTAGAADAAS